MSMIERLGREFNRSFDKLEAEIAQWRDAAGLIPGDETAHDPSDLTPSDLRRWMGKTLDRSRVALLKAELDATAEKSFSPRFWAKEVAA